VKLGRRRRFPTSQNAPTGAKHGYEGDSCGACKEVSHTPESAGVALGIEAEMIVPFRRDDYFVKHIAIRCRLEVPPPLIVGGGMVQSL